MKKSMFCLVAVMALCSFTPKTTQNAFSGVSQEDIYTEQQTAEIGDLAQSNVLSLSGTIAGDACDIYYDFGRGKGTFHQYNRSGTITRTLRLTLYNGSRLEFDAYAGKNYVSHFSGHLRGGKYSGTVTNTKGGQVNFVMYLED